MKKTTTKYFMPEKVVLFSKPYSVSYFEKLSDVDKNEDEFVYGEIRFREAAIRMFKNSPTERDHYRILAHELVHAIVNDMNIDFKNDDEEKIIDNLALGIADIIVGNGYTKKIT